ncbi:MAG: dTMP kinase, partial [Alphaproteobacteria bacterium]|nr:dTMP kinase [Alphaproteobacteria bacterium]
MLGRFITFEGGEGAGKSTQIALLSKAFTAAALEHITTREPGGSQGAEAIRELVVTGAVDRWHPATEALLFMTARYDHLETLIRPALATGKWVLCDRFYDSTYVYQGLSKQVGEEWLDGVYNHLYGTIAPAMTLLLDIPVEQGLARAQARRGSEMRFESMDISFHESLRDGFIRLAAAEPQRIHML